MMTSPFSPVKKPAVDPRFKRLVEQLFSSYETATGLKLAPCFDASDGRALKKMLASVDIPLSDLSAGWDRFLASTDEFDQRQIGSKPVRYWASRVNKWLLKGPVGVGSGNKASPELESMLVLERRRIQLLLDHAIIPGKPEWWDTGLLGLWPAMLMEKGTIPQKDSS